MILNEQTVNVYRELMTRPKENGVDIPSLEDIFEKTDTAEEGKHITFRNYLNIVSNGTPKLIFYIVMDSLYQQKVSPDGSIGYCVKIKLNNDD